MSSPYPSIRWILDWDSTITTHDTLSTLVNISASSPSRKPAQKQHILKEWSHLSRAYVDDLEQTLEIYHRNKSDVDSSLAAEKEVLQVIEHVEARSLSRVCESRIFSGLTESDVTEGAKSAVKNAEVRLRRGFGEFYHRHIRHSSLLSSSSALTTNSLMSREDNEQTENEEDDKVQVRRGGALFTILSVNWSRHFIASCLSSSQPSIQIPPSSIISNELEGFNYSQPPHTKNSHGKDTETTGAIQSTHPASPLILSSRHKLAIFESLFTWHFPSHLSSSSDEKQMVVYIGDSMTDLECLLAADLGICMRDHDGDDEQKGGRELAEALERIGVRCLRLGDFDNREEKGGGEWIGGERVKNEKVMAWARDFDEINAWLEDGRKRSFDGSKLEREIRCHEQKNKQM